MNNDRHTWRLALCAAVAIQLLLPVWTEAATRNAAQESPAPTSGANQGSDAAAAAETGDGPQIQGIRDPFWPVNWTPSTFSSEDAEERTRPVRWDDAQSRIVVKGITLAANGRRFAVVDEIGIVTAGDVIEMPYERMLYRWRVKAINADGLVMDRISVEESKQ